MSRLRFRISILLDGFVAGPHQSVEHPLGIGGIELHQWVFPLAVWRAMPGLPGGDHAVPFRELVAVHVAVPDTAALSIAACAARAAAPLAYFSGAPLLELVFDGAPAVVRDLRPSLPLVLRGR